MKQIKLKLIIFISLIMLLQNCSGAREAFEGQKRSEQSDEFLVKKKNPLQMPPDMNKLPQPGDDFETENIQNNQDVKELLKINKNQNKTNESESDLISDMLKKIQ